MFAQVEQAKRHDQQKPERVRRGAKPAEQSRPRPASRACHPEGARGEREEQGLGVDSRQEECGREERDYEDREPRRFGVALAEFEVREQPDHAQPDDQRCDRDHHSRQQIARPECADDRYQQRVQREEGGGCGREPFSVPVLCGRHIPSRVPARERCHEHVAYRAHVVDKPGWVQVPGGAGRPEDEVGAGTGEEHDREHGGGGEKDVAHRGIPPNPEHRPPPPARQRTSLPETRR